MAIRFFTPHPALAPYIQNYGHVAFMGVDTMDTIQVDFFPHGFSALIYNLNPDRMVADVANQQQFDAFFRFSGQYDAHRAYHCRSAHFVFINFKPHGAHFLLGLPQAAFLNAKIEMADIFPKMGGFYQQLEDQSNHPMAILDLLEKWLLNRLSFIKNHDTDRFDWAIGCIKQHQGKLPIRNLARQLGMSMTSMEDHFKEKIGLSPKMFSRILRFNACYRYIKSQQNESWASIAYQFQYFDQMHFIKEFKQFFGYTPTKFEQSQWNMSHLLTR